MEETNLKPKYIVIKLIDDILIQDVNKHKTLAAVREFMYTNFGENNYYIISEDEYKTINLTIVNRRKEITIVGHRFLLYFYYKEREIYDKITQELYDVSNFLNEGLRIVNKFQLTKDRFKKHISLEKYMFFIGLDKLITIQENLDPTSNKKYFDWLCKIEMIKKTFSEDFDKTNILLTDFDNPQVKSLIKKAGYSLDINSYLAINDLFKVVKECYYDKLDEVESGNREILYQKRKIFEDNKWLVVIPNTHDEAVTIGRGTNWCTSADSKDGKENYSYYTDNGKRDLVVFINKSTNNKYQYSVYSSDFLDENDDRFDLENIFDIDFIINFDNEYEKIPVGFKKILGNYDKDIYNEYYLLTLDDGIKANHIRNDEHLDVFINDSDVFIREKVAEKGYGLDILINDSSPTVRATVAKKGYGLDILQNDEDRDVRITVIKYHHYNIEKFITDPNQYVRRAVAEEGVGLETLVHDEYWDVRRAVATYKYGLEILVNDPEESVRLEVAKKGYGLDILINDKDLAVRLEVAKQGYGWDILILEDDWDINEVLLENNYGLEILRKSKHNYIAEKAERKIFSQMMTNKQK